VVAAEGFHLRCRTNYHCAKRCSRERSGFFAIKAGGYLRVVTRLAATCGALAVCLALAAPVAAQSARLPAPPLSFELDLAFVSLPGADPTVGPGDTELHLVGTPNPDPVTPEDARRAHRGRLLLAMGVPALVAGTLGIVWSQPAKRGNCYSDSDTMRGTLITGTIVATLGLGATTAGIVSLVRASKAARDAPKSKKSRRRIAGGATGAILLSIILVVGVGAGDSIGCYSS
jgi:hypothetical protein